MDRGVTASDVPNDAIEFGVHELMSGEICAGIGNRLLSGAIAGIVGALTVASLHASIS